MYLRRDFLKTMSFGAFSMLSNGATSSTRNSQLATSYRNFSFEHGAHSTGWLPFERSEDQHIIIPAMLNTHPGDIILDSGTGTTVLDLAFATKLGLKERAGFRSVGVTGTIQTMSADGLNIAIGNLTIRPSATSLIDLSSISAVTGRSILAIVGRNIFDLLVADIDFSKKRFVFSEARPSQIDTTEFQLPLRKDNMGLREIPLSVEAGRSVQAVFDLGSDTPLYFSPEYVAKHDLFRGKRTSTSMSTGAEGAGINQIAVLDSITLGHTVLHQIPVEVPKTWKHAAPAFVGLPILRRFRLIIDYNHDFLSLIPDRRSIALPFQKDRSGIGAIADGNDLRVVNVATGSPAERAGLRVGDKIIAINGRELDSKYFQSHPREGSKPAGTALQITLKNGSQIDLTLADYY